MISGSQNSKWPELIDKKIGAGDEVGDDFTHAKMQNDRPIRGDSAYAWNITLAWYLLPCDAMLAQYMPSSCVCLPVRHIQGTLVFWWQRLQRSSNCITPLLGRRCSHLTDFDEILLWWCALAVPTRLATKILKFWQSNFAVGCHLVSQKNAPSPLGIFGFDKILHGCVNSASRSSV